MSWSIFKSQLLVGMQSYSYGNDINQFVKQFTASYDLAIRTGGDTINRVSVIKGNTVLMETTLLSIIQQTQLSNNRTLLDSIGPAVISYWVGVEFSKIPPLIPAIGAISNITTLNGLVISTGKWPPLPVLPNANSNTFLDAFINSANIHLSTLSGIFTVLAQYPPPAPPAPAILNWTGYKVIG